MTNKELAEGIYNEAKRRLEAQFALYKTHMPKGYDLIFKGGELILITHSEETDEK